MIFKKINKINNWIRNKYYDYKYPDKDDRSAAVITQALQNPAGKKALAQSMQAPIRIHLHHTWTNYSDYYADIWLWTSDFFNIKNYRKRFFKSIRLNAYVVFHWNVYSFLCFIDVDKFSTYCSEDKPQVELFNIPTSILFSEVV